MAHEFMGYEDGHGNPIPYDDMLNDVIHPTKSGNKKNKKGDKSPKDKKPAVPIIPSYEGYIFTPVPTSRSGEPMSWILSHKTQMQSSGQELADKARLHHKQTGVGLSGHFQSLGLNQQILVNRFVNEKNASEKVPNAEWRVFGVRKLYKEERRNAFKTDRINHALRVTLRRGDKLKEVVREPDRPYPGAEVDPGNVYDLRKPVTKKDAGTKDTKVKKNKKKDTAEASLNDLLDDPHVVNIPEQYPEYPGEPTQDNWPRQATFGDPFGGLPAEISGALPNDIPRDAIPIPEDQMNNAPPPVPMPPQPHSGNPFQPVPGVPFDQFEDRQPRDPVAYGNQHMSPRRPSHSRRRPSVDSGRSHSSDLRKIADELRSEIRAEARGAARGEARAIAAENKVDGWSAGFGPSTGSSRSTAQDDIWSSRSSLGRRPSYSTPGTSPERPFHTRDSSRARPFVDERRRYYPDQNRIIKPHDTPRERGRDARYAGERRQRFDDHSSAHVRPRSRPPVQRRLTHHAEALRDADYVRQRGEDFERMRPHARDDRYRHAVYNDGRDRRQRQPLPRWA